jgi:hypothetical protein
MERVFGVSLSGKPAGGSFRLRRLYNTLSSERNGSSNLGSDLFLATYLYPITTEISRRAGKAGSPASALSVPIAVPVLEFPLLLLLPQSLEQPLLLAFPLQLPLLRFPYDLP